MVDLSEWRRYRWRLIRGEPLDPLRQMALEEVLTRRVAAGERQPTLRFWEWTQPAAVLGRFQSVRNEVDVAAAQRHGVAIVRRISGGGTMFIEPAGAITYSLYVPPALVGDLSFVESYAALDAWVVETLRGLGLEVWYEPVNSMMARWGKIAGAAQKRQSGVVLHHTTMAYQMDQYLLRTVLRLDRERLSERGVASVVRPVGPLRLQTDLTRAEIVERLIQSFQSGCAPVEDAITAAELAQADRLVETKFATADWLYAVP